jgi:hypothetical protein
MKGLTAATRAGIVLGLYVLPGVLSGCVVTEHREGYWDREHHRWWHEHAWVMCESEDAHCR